MNPPIDEEAFWARVNKLGSNKCWEWTGAITSGGYGSLVYKQQSYVTHRIAAYLYGLVPSIKAPQNKKEQGFILHKCDNRKCCNPNHLSVGSYRDNLTDCYQKKRRTQPKGERHTNAKLSNAQAQEIRKRYKTGETQTKLAQAFKVSQVAVSLIVRGKTYA